MSLRSVLLLYLALGGVLAEIFLPCAVPGDLVHDARCTCGRPHAPIISCASLGLTSLPSATRAHTLNLHDNLLTALPAGSFYSVQDIHKVILSKNLIQTVDAEAFWSTSPTFESLDLSDNRLSAVPRVFSLIHQHTPGNLTHLDLASNYIDRLRSGAFRALRGLRGLYLEGNPLGVISVSAWRGPGAIVSLSLSPGGRDVTRIPVNHLENLTSLRLTDGRGEKLARWRSWFESLPRLEHLHLNRMGLRDLHLTKSSFPAGWKLRLKTLDLSDNEITEFPGNVLKFPNLQELDLSLNFIESISKYKRFPPSLRKLNISHNGLGRLGSRPLLNLTRATSIDISSNKLSTLNLDWRQVSEALNPDLVLRIGNNDWACVCGITWIKTLISRQITASNGHLTPEEIHSTIRCRGTYFNRKYDGFLVKDVPDEIFTCTDIFFQGET